MRTCFERNRSDFRFLRSLFSLLELNRAAAFQSKGQANVIQMCLTSRHTVLACSNVDALGLPCLYLQSCLWYAHGNQSSHEWLKELGEKKDVETFQCLSLV